ncbi:hypothetical protein BGZ74_005946 [Mortierella antarctica]|nr:hypothetical protein BGZ74_005946 [Mortierella antarctica]
MVTDISAAHYLPSKAFGGVLEILGCVPWTKSLGSICYGSSTPLGPISQWHRTSWKEIRFFAYKLAFYNVAVYGMVYDSAANNIRARMAEQQVPPPLGFIAMTSNATQFCIFAQPAPPVPQPQLEQQHTHFDTTHSEASSAPIYDPLINGASSSDYPVPLSYPPPPPQPLLTPDLIDTSIPSSAPIYDPDLAPPAYQNPAPVPDHTSYKNKRALALFLLQLTALLGLTVVAAQHYQYDDEYRYYLYYSTYYTEGDDFPLFSTETEDMIGLAAICLAPGFVVGLFTLVPLTTR